MTPTERTVLEVLASGEDYGGFCYFNFAGICGKTGLDRKTIRRACRSLARKGLAEYGSALWNADGEVGGAGYCATPEGRKAVAE